MKKMDTVRQNRCDREMNVILFGLYFLFFAMQLFVGETDHPSLVNGINMSLWTVISAGFLFRAGSTFGAVTKTADEDIGKQKILRMAGGYFFAYLTLAVLQEILLNGTGKKIALFQVISFLELPGIPAVFLAVSIALAAAWMFYHPLRKLIGNRKSLIIVIGILVLSVFLKARGQSYVITAALFGAEGTLAVPVVPYLAWFLLGFLVDEKKPGLRMKVIAVSAGITVIGLLLYRTPLQDLARLILPAFPVYLIYVISDFVSDLSLRFYAVRFVSETTEIVFAVYAAILLAAKKLNLFGTMDVGKTLLLAIALTAALYFVVIGIWAFSLCCQRFIGLWQGIRHKKAVYFLIFTVVFILLFGLAFLAFFLDGRSLIWSKDGISQYYPRAVYYANLIRSMIREFLNGNFELPMYDFRLGMGGEITFSLEPLYFLFALFGAEHVEFAYNLIVFLRFYLAGISFSIFCFYFGKDYFTTFISTCVYVFCGFSLYGGARHTMFMIPMILFPMLIISMEEIIRKKRWYLCTIFVALSLFSNYYFLYMCTFGMGIYFLVRFFCQKEKEQRSFRNFLGRGFTIVGSYLLGAAMSCIVLATTFGLYVGSGRTGLSVIKTPSLFFYSTSWLVRLFMSFPVTNHAPGDWMRLGFLPIAFFALIVLCMRKGRKELKILCAVSLILLALPLTGFVMNGFSSISNRWCFMLALLYAYVTAEVLPDMQKLDRKELAVLLIGTGIYGFFAFYGTVMSNQYSKIGFLLLGFTFLCILLSQMRIERISRAAKQSILLMMTVVLVFVNSYTLYGMADVTGEYTINGAVKQQAEDTPLRAIAQIDDESFFRVAVPKLNYWTISSSIILDYNSITMFNSTLNGSIMEYLEKMGSTGYSATQMLGLSNRTLLSALASVKYYAYYDTPARSLPYGYEEVLVTDLDGQTTTVCENQYALPIGYTYRDSISKEELESYDTVQRQEVLLQKVMLEEEAELSDDSAELRSTLRKLDYTVSDESQLKLTEHSLTVEKEENADSSYTLRLNFEGLPNSETYVVLKNAVMHGDGSEAGMSIYFTTETDDLSYKFRPDDDRYGTQQEDYILNLGYSETAIDGCTVRFGSDKEIQFDSLEIYSQPMEEYPEYIDRLREEVLEEVEIGTNSVSGTISLDQEKYLVLSIPYQNGWTAYVDGEKTELLKANYMYMALPLSAGDHTIRLEFEIPAVKYALVIMPASMVLFIILLMAGKFRKIRKKSREK